MDIWSEVPASVSPDPVIVPLGNAMPTPAIVVLDDGTSRAPAQVHGADQPMPKQARRQTRRRGQEVTER